jgi:DNA-binding PadR family transcriptional regulator
VDADDVLSSSNVLDLAVLGILSERARTAAEVVAITKRLGGGRFQPTSDVIAGRMASLVETGLLAPLPDEVAGELPWQLTASGRAHVQRLLMMPSAPPVNALAAVCACLKICFLELLESDARNAVLDDLMAAHRRALRQAEGALSNCPCRCALVQRYLAREVERWADELTWLEGLAGDLALVEAWRP